MDLGGQLSFLIPQILPSSVQGSQEFNYFFGLAMAFGLVYIVIAILVRTISRG